MPKSTKILRTPNITSACNLISQNTPISEVIKTFLKTTTTTTTTTTTRSKQTLLPSFEWHTSNTFPEKSDSSLYPKTSKERFFGRNHICSEELKKSILLPIECLISNKILKKFNRFCANFQFFHFWA